MLLGGWLRWCSRGHSMHAPWQYDDNTVFEDPVAVSVTDKGGILVADKKRNHVAVRWQRLAVCCVAANHTLITARLLMLLAPLLCTRMMEKMISSHRTWQ